MLDAEDRHLIWLSGQSWDCVSGSDRNMAVALSRYARVLWVDSPVSPATKPVGSASAARVIKPRITELSDRMTRLSTVALPGLTRPGVRATTPALVRVQVRWAIRKLGIRPAAVVAAYLGDLLGDWGDDVVNVLYGTDDYVAGAELMGISAGHLRIRERRALARADVIIAVTPQLAQRWSGLGTDAIVIPNGCWPDEGDAPSAPAEVTGLSYPVVGLVGYVGDRIDINALTAIADAEISLLLVGAKDPQWEQQRFLELISRPHVRYTGAVPSTAVRAYMSAIDVGITPYRDTAFNRASFPLKTLEYLGAGVPVVSASLPAARWLLDDLKADDSGSAADHIIMLADRAADYVPAIRRLTSDSAVLGNSRAKNCIAFAERHSWPRRAEAFAAAIGLVPSRPSTSDESPAWS
jgi:teichuronic acid biosynthesis glycosyltransferase TuaH